MAFPILQLLKIVFGKELKDIAALDNSTEVVGVAAVHKEVVDVMVSVITR